MQVDLDKLRRKVEQMKPLEEKVASLEKSVEELMVSVKSLELQIERLQMSYGTLLTWMSQSANSPIRITEVGQLIKIMQMGLDNADPE